MLSLFFKLTHQPVSTPRRKIPSLSPPPLSSLILPPSCCSPSKKKAAQATLVCARGHLDRERLLLKKKTWDPRVKQSEVLYIPSPQPPLHPQVLYIPSPQPPLHPQGLYVPSPQPPLHPQEPVYVTTHSSQNFALQVNPQLELHSFNQRVGSLIQRPTSIEDIEKVRLW
ncbi:hypothetical protein FHG87_004804 [Trinorchestia longiramus]|nr:hypothetical protein FHG87_004804 [Trinorchestia longiramus]